MKIDDIEKILSDINTPLYRRFITACVLVDALNPLAKDKIIDDDMQNNFYKYYKQGAFGDECREPTCPSMFYYVRYTKWNVWNEVAGMPQKEAQEKYVDYGIEVINQIKENEQAIKIISALNSEILKKRYDEKQAAIIKELAKHGKKPNENGENIAVKDIPSVKAIPDVAKDNQNVKPIPQVAKDIPNVKAIPEIAKNISVVQTATVNSAESVSGVNGAGKTGNNVAWTSAYSSITASTSSVRANRSHQPSTANTRSDNTSEVSRNNAGTKVKTKV